MRLSSQKKITGTFGGNLTLGVGGGGVQPMKEKEEGRRFCEEEDFVGQKSHGREGKQTRHALLCLKQDPGGAERRRGRGGYN